MQGELHERAKGLFVPDWAERGAGASACQLDLAVFKRKTERLRAEYAKKRREGAFEPSLALILDAIVLYRESDQLRSFLWIGATEHSTEGEMKLLRELAASYADSLGRAGGLLRRLEQLPLALAAYAEGALYESNERLQIRASYNTVNRIIAQIEATHRSSVDLLDEIISSLDLLKRQTTGPRREESWAHADYAQCLLLAASHFLEERASYRKEAEVALRRFAGLGTLPDIETCLRVLDGLEKALLESHDPAYEDICEGSRILREEHYKKKNCIVLEG